MRKIEDAGRIFFGHPQFRKNRIFENAFTAFFALKSHECKELVLKGPPKKMFFYFRAADSDPIEAERKKLEKIVCPPSVSEKTFFAQKSRE